MSGALPPALVAYRLGVTLLSPLLPLLLRARLRRGKEDPARLCERHGQATCPRPEGALIWAHGASIGEALALLPVVEALVRRGCAVLVTSGTRTSAEIMARRLPPGSLHQYIPADVPRFLRRFLDHWRPQLVLFAESELWPASVTELARRNIPLALVNARMSPRSFARWRRMPWIAGPILSRISLCVAQSEGDAGRLTQLGAPHAQVSGNLKFDITPPPADPREVETTAALLAGRPVWLAASTHPGEDEMVLASHRAMAARHPGLLTLIAPRHPERGADIAALAEQRGLEASRRSTGARVEPSTEVHVVDSVGELGLFYRIVPLVFMGGSLVPRGGQNPIEPARLGAAIVHGPHVANFAEVYAAFDRDGGALEVAGERELAAAMGDLLEDPALLRDMSRAAGRTMSGFSGALARTMLALAPFLPRDARMDAAPRDRGAP